MLYTLYAASMIHVDISLGESFELVSELAPASAMLARSREYTALDRVRSSPQSTRIRRSNEMASVFLDNFHMLVDVVIDVTWSGSVESAGQCLLQLLEASHVLDCFSAPIDQ